VFPDRPITVNSLVEQSLPSRDGLIIPIPIELPHASARSLVGCPILQEFVSADDKTGEVVNDVALRPVEGPASRSELRASARGRLAVVAWQARNI
jgi:hypothetical protein